MSMGLAVRKAIAELRAKPTISRERVHNLEAAMRELPERVQLTVKHYFSEGVYAREGVLPAGTMLVGKIHKWRNMNILSKGEISVLIDGHMQRVSAPFTFVAAAGAKRIIYAHVESVLTTIHGTNETDLETIEAHFIAQDEQEYQAFLDKHKGETPCG